MSETATIERIPIPIDGQIVLMDCDEQLARGAKLVDAVVNTVRAGHVAVDEIGEFLCALKAGLKDDERFADRCARLRINLKTAYRWMKRWTEFRGDREKAAAAVRARNAGMPDAKPLDPDRLTGRTLDEAIRFQRHGADTFSRARKSDAGPDGDACSDSDCLARETSDGGPDGDACSDSDCLARETLDDDDLFGDGPTLTIEQRIERAKAEQAKRGQVAPAAARGERGSDEVGVGSGEAVGADESDATDAALPSSRPLGHSGSEIGECRNGTAHAARGASGSSPRASDVPGQMTLEAMFAEAEKAIERLIALVRGGDRSVAEAILELDQWAKRPGSPYVRAT